MADEHEFIEDGLQRSQIDEFFEDELGRAGYGGMDVAHTPMGTQIVLKAEKPGMVIGKGGKNIRKITTQLEERFDLEDPQVDVQEVDEPDLNARIVADRLANALERGWYFRKAGHTTIDRIMDAGALGAQIVLAGKLTGARSRIEKFNRGYIKHNGEPAEEIVDHGQGVAVMKLGTIGVTVQIIPPGAELPDDFEIDEEADVSDLVVDEEEAGSVEELLEGEPDEEDLEEAGKDFEEVDTPAGGAPEELAEEDLEEVADEAAAEANAANVEGDAAAEDVEEEQLEDLEEDTEEEAEALIEEMEEDAEFEGDEPEEEGEE